MKQKKQPLDYSILRANIKQSHVELNCIRLEIDLTTFKLGITCQRLPYLPARRSMRRRGSVWRRDGVVDTEDGLQPVPLVVRFQFGLRVILRPPIQPRTVITVFTKPLRLGLRVV